MSSLVRFLEMASSTAFSGFISSSRREVDGFLATGRGTGVGLAVAAAAVGGGGGSAGAHSRHLGGREARGVSPVIRRGGNDRW